jgi:hypothetical protein
MTATPTPIPGLCKSKRWYQRWFIRLVVIVLMGALIYSSITYWRYSNNTRRLEAAMAAAAADMPDWQWGKHFETGSFAPGEPNLAEDITQWMLKRGLTERRPRAVSPVWIAAYQQWERTNYTFLPGMDRVDLAISEHPTSRLPTKVLGDLQPIFARTDAITDLNELRNWADRPAGRFDRTLNGLGHLILLPMVQKTRELVNMLTWDAVISAEEGRADQALFDLRACAMLARSHGDDPFMICQLVRIALGSTGASKLTRVLAQADRCDPRQLALLQAEYLAEAERPILLAMLRGWRALMHHDLVMLQNDAVQRRKFVDSGYLKIFGELPIDTGMGWLNRWLLKVTPDSFYFPGAAQWPLEQAAMLEYLNALVGVAKRPETEWLDGLNGLPSREHLPKFSRSLTFNLWFGGNSTDHSPFTRLVQSALRYRAQLRCAAAACAAERFRLECGRFPSGFAELVPAYLPAVPSDPFTGKPLIWKTLANGIVIYSVDRDGVDNGGEVLQKFDNPPKDSGTRLWHPAQRRQAPIPYDPPGDEKVPEEKSDGAK